jgi:hypothetical protein
MGFVSAAGILVLLAGQAAGDRFTAQRDAAAARNPRSPRFTIALEGSRRTFHIGEPIPLVFTYDNLNRSSHGARNRTYRHFADAVLDRSEGTGRPFEDFERSGLYISGGICCGVPAGLVGGATTRFGGIGFDASGVPHFLPDVVIPPPPPPPPVRMTFLLNEGVRFDAPGRYRLYMADRHDRAYAYGRPAPPPLISNIVELEITGRDQTWEAQTLRDAVSVLEDGSADPLQRTDAARTVRFLGSRAAIDVMARRLLAPDAANFELEQGLFAARERDYAIAVMAAHVHKASRLVRDKYRRTLAALRGTRSRPRQALP